MFVNKRPLRIEWGHCDPAGIVFYPRYFEMFDASTHALFEAATGIRKPELTAMHGIMGIPMVDTRAVFRAPSKHGDDVVIESRVSRWGRSSFDIEHRLVFGAELRVECAETRIWAAQDAAGGNLIVPRPVPQSVKACFEKHQ